MYKLDRITNITYLGVSFYTATFGDNRSIALESKFGVHEWINLMLKNVLLEGSSAIQIANVLRVAIYLEAFFFIFA